MVADEPFSLPVALVKSCVIGALDLQAAGGLLGCRA